MKLKYITMLKYNLVNDFDNFFTSFMFVTYESCQEKLIIKLRNILNFEFSIKPCSLATERVIFSNFAFNNL